MIGLEGKDVEWILIGTLVKKGVVQILAKAKTCRYFIDNKINMSENHSIQLKYIKNEKITYGGIPLNEIFEDNSDYKNRPPVFITYEVQDVFYTSKKVFICTPDTNGTEEISYNLDIWIHCSSLHRFFREYKYPEIYEELRKIINNSSLWQKENLTQKIPKNPDVDKIVQQLSSDLNFDSTSNPLFKSVNAGFLNKIKSRNS